MGGLFSATDKPSMGGLFSATDKPSMGGLFSATDKPSKKEKKNYQQNLRPPTFTSGGLIIIITKIHFCFRRF